MATATPSILINSISGKIGNVVFYTRLGTQCVRAHVVPRNPDTQAQRAVRRSFGDAVRSWQSTSPEEKYAYNRKARHLNMSGYNLFISKYIKTNITPIETENLLNQNSSLARAKHGRRWPSASAGRVRAPEKALASLSFIPFPSVSESYMNRYGQNAALICRKLRPG